MLLNAAAGIFPLPYFASSTGTPAAVRSALVAVTVPAVPVSDVAVSDVPVLPDPGSDVPGSDVPVSDVPVSDVPGSDVPVSPAPAAMLCDNAEANDSPEVALVVLVRDAAAVELPVEVTTVARWVGVGWKEAMRAWISAMRDMAALMPSTMRTCPRLDQRSVAGFSTDPVDTLNVSCTP